ncbi:hypothetical protein PVK06_036200 [Gossypium arboreum]|uniref:Pyruvate kinase n=1 Tax=Gossypium arboreum TaxID=29729 RepID=A0ABR0NK20_GOSAR|nr:hypothetical protein PVK06_036200 [Gossypium arboreum]
MIWERARTLSKDFRIFNFTEPPVFSPIQTNECWEKPPNGYIKVNVDAAVSKGCRGFGAIARDHDGFVLGGCYKFREETLDVGWAELEAFKEGIKLAEKLNLTQLILESDSAVLVNKELPNNGCIVKTKIVCTLGTTSLSIPMIEKLLRVGMNVARFNFSHGSHKYH